MCHMKFALCMQYLVSYLHSSAALIQENGRIISEQDEEYERILLNDLCKQAELLVLQQQLQSKCATRENTELKGTMRRYCLST